MKRVISLTLALVCLLALAGCGPKEEPLPSTTATQAEWAEAQEVLDLLPPSDLLKAYDLVATVAVEDKAYDRVGAALFSDAQADFSILAFMAADGGYQYCAVESVPLADHQLTYQGNGVVTFRVESDEGPRVCQITTTSSDNDADLTLDILPGAF